MDSRGVSDIFPLGQPSPAETWPPHHEAQILYRGGISSSSIAHPSLIPILPPPQTQDHESKASPIPLLSHIHDPGTEEYSRCVQLDLITALKEAPSCMSAGWCVAFQGERGERGAMGAMGAMGRGSRRESPGSAIVLHGGSENRKQKTEKSPYVSRGVALISRP